MQVRHVGIMLGLLAFSACGDDAAAPADASLTPDSSATLDGGPAVDAAPDAFHTCAACYAIDPGTHDFGDLTVAGPGATATFTVSNMGADTGTAQSAAISGSPDFSVASTTCGAPLDPGKSCVVVVRLTPTTVGSKSGTLSVTAAFGGVVAATLNGTGTP